MFEVISLDNKKRWNEIVRSMKSYDFYFLAEYHQLDSSGIPLLLHYQNGQDSLAMPVVVRNIEGTDYKDITSVYGYGGPLANVESPADKSISGFQEELKQFFDSNNIVSAFSRLHPLLPNGEQLLVGLGETKEENLTVGIDLKLPEEEQKKQYARSLKYTINKLKRMGVTVRKASSKKEIDFFIEMYNETMDRVNASPNYYFPKEYFYHFLESIDSFMLLAFYDEKIVSGCFCTVCHGIMQAHLNATKDEFLYLSPLKLVLDEARLTGIQRELRILHLGGGFRGINDSLFVFKSRFSKRQFTFKVWKYIHKPTVYADLVFQKGDKNATNRSFFPLYRLK
jgi:hypothetical protein